MRTRTHIAISVALLTLSVATLACPGADAPQPQEAPEVAALAPAKVVGPPAPAEALGAPGATAEETVDHPKDAELGSKNNPYTEIPPAFGPRDEYSSHDEACLGWVKDTVPEKWQRAVIAWCEHRSYHSSRNGVVVSRVDGTQIHDRDRPTAWMFYQKQVLKGKLDPEVCPYHRINRNIPHPPECKRLARNWPFGDVKLTSKIKNQWMNHPHDMERFGARGPHDWNANAYNHLPGCWDPAQLERFDVGIGITVKAALAICERFGCRNKWDIKKYWGRWAPPAE